MKIEISGVQKLYNRLKVEYNKFLSYSISVEQGRLLSELVANTPIDTGYARSRWSLTNSQGIVTYNLVGEWFFEKEFQVSNDAKYITALNRGHSKQAPPFFIESTILRRGYIIKSVSVSPKGV